MSAIDIFNEEPTELDPDTQEEFYRLLKRRSQLLNKKRSKIEILETEDVDIRIAEIMDMKFPQRASIMEKLKELGFVN